MKILIVEDDLEISKLLADFLQGNGYEVLCQYDGLHVLDCIQEHQIDLILLDIMLPYRSGDTILADIRKFSTVPVIVISAKETTQNKIDLLRLGADDYITKPFDMEEVLARIESNLRRICGTAFLKEELYHELPHCKSMAQQAHLQPGAHALYHSGARRGVWRGAVLGGGHRGRCGPCLPPDKAGR